MQLLQEAQRDEAVGVKTESKSENPAAEAEKSVPIVKKDVENVPPQKAPVSWSLRPCLIRFLIFERLILIRMFI